jgi:hypothetical protein
MTGNLNNRQPLQEEIETPPTHKNKLNFFGNRTSGTFAFAASAQANPKAKAKEPLFCNALLTALQQ